MAASLKAEGDGLVAATMMVGIGYWNLSQFLGKFESVLNQCSCGFELVLNRWWLWVESFGGAEVRAVRW